MCGIRIEKDDKDKWHNLNIVRHLRLKATARDRDMTASFHVCTEDLKNLMFEVLGVNVDKEHLRVLRKKIEEKLRLTI